MSVTETLLRPLLAAGGARPLITFYDDAAGHRIELSSATVANWAAKTANWLRDELDVEPGMPVAVRLPAHWQTLGVLLGAWWCGAEVRAETAGAEVAIIPAAEVAGTRDATATATAPAEVVAALGARTVAVVGLDALGAPVRLPADAGVGLVDYTSEIRVYGDDFTVWEPVGGDAPALAGADVDTVLASARARAAELGIGATDRVLSTLDWTVPEGVAAHLLPVLVSGASLVQCHQADPAKLAGRREAERVTRVLGKESAG
ncbi:MULTISPECIES: TIGR03089 family protein [Actinoalloteichus]|uniref:TIGR03089 family protein n=1 Tax=Actinoalloteichus fjordicus TaxID=1612552 RepID=A0AAC9PUR1_9PSEU|nr:MULTISPECIES: TIGR03089 family protein [Actinoalloteichus]APU17345.1 putative TIGR03089 family protein [Actinoalloteichus fjordicus]APU23429.1 putative TIGR03089 family protein [Actinoalloteichus sp. GBA129-24]